jgi:16S rRNA (uracil1498-N3)-methyltransferase
VRRVRIASGYHAGDTVTLPQAEAHYVARVLRLRSGHEVQAFDGAGQSYRLRLTTVSATTVQGQLLALLSHATVGTAPLLLGQAIPKGAKMDLIVEKCAELGLSTLVPVYTARTVVREVAARLPEKLARWQRVGAAAARQCGRQVLLDLCAPLSWADFCVHYSAAPVKLVCWEEEARYSLRQALHTLSRPQPLVVLIGPEGGLTSEEVALARAHGFVTVGLGPHILRTETAAIAVTSIIRYHFGAFEPQGGRP